MKKALVTGAGGFIGGHLVERLKNEGYWVRGADIKEHEYRKTHADEFLICDLRKPSDCIRALTTNNVDQSEFDEVYNLAADMGGMGFIHTQEAEIMHNNVLINVHMIDAAAKMKVPRYFYSSSVCIYRNMKIGEPELSEEEAYPAQPDNEYGWEKLYSERITKIYSKYYPIVTRIARFQNCYGPYGTWKGGREKAPAALCRKVAETSDGIIEVWGDGTAVRSYTYVTDLVDGIYRLMHSDIENPANIGNPEYVSVDDLAYTIAGVANKIINIRHVDGPVGVQSRNFTNSSIYRTGWKANVSLKEGIKETYKWIEKQVYEASK